MVAIRGTYHEHSDGGYSYTYVPCPPGTEAGDLVYLFVAGGNQPYYAQWEQVHLAQGQEAQGAIYRKVATGPNDGTYLYFDGYGPYDIVTIGFVGQPARASLTFLDRVGVTGTTQSAQTYTPSPNDLLPDDTEIAFAWLRAPGAPPSASRGSLLESSANMGFWAGTVTDPDAASLNFDLATHSGRFLTVLKASDTPDIPGNAVSTAIELAPGVPSAPLSIEGLDREALERNAISGKTAWYRFMPLYDAVISIKTALSVPLGAADTYLSAYTGPYAPKTPAQLDLINNHDDVDPDDPSSMLQFEAYAYVDYYFRVDTYEGSTTDYVLVVDIEDPPDIPQSETVGLSPNRARFRPH